MSPYIIPGIIGNPNLDFKGIIKMVLSYFDITEDELRKKSRKSEVVFARKLVYYFAIKYTPLSSKEIGKYFRQDHTTALHAAKKLHEYIKIKDAQTIDLFYPFFQQMVNQYVLFEYVDFDKKEAKRKSKLIVREYKRITQYKMIN